MKTITTIVLVLCSIAVFGQIKTTRLDTLPTFGSSGTSFPGSFSTYYMTPPKIQGYYFQLFNTKTVIRANYPDSTGLVKVWLNRKEITWTSDSTFTYKTDQK